MSTALTMLKVAVLMPMPNPGEHDDRDVAGVLAEGPQAMSNVAEKSSHGGLDGVAGFLLPGGCQAGVRQ